MSATAPLRRSTALATAVMLVASLLVALVPSRADAATNVVFDDMEHGDPWGNGWFAFDGTGIAASADVPPGTGGSWSLAVDTSGTGYVGGFGRTNEVSIAGTNHFTFWINPDAGQEYSLELNLQDDGDRLAPNADEFQFVCQVGASGPCAVSGGGWQHVSIPLADFTDDDSFYNGGNGMLDDPIVNVVVAVIGAGTDVDFRTDDWVFVDVPTIIDDFEGLTNPLPDDFFTFQDGSTNVEIGVTTTPPSPVPGSADGNTVFTLGLDVTAYGGVIRAFGGADPASWAAQDWSGRAGIGMWVLGTGSGKSFFVEILENRAPGSTADTAERWGHPFKDDFTGWQYLEFPFADFTRKEIGNGAPNDGLTLFQVHGWAIGTDNAGAVDLHVDDVLLYGTAPVADMAVNFSSGITEITEGTTGNVAVKLNRPFIEGDPDEVRISYTTEPGTAEPGRDYTPASGELVFTSDGPTELTFPIETFGDDKFLGNKRIVLRLSDPVGVELGSGFQASAIIVDDDPYDRRLVDDFEYGAYLFDATPPSEVSAVDVSGNGTEHALQVEGPIVEVPQDYCSIRRPERSRGVIPITFLSTPSVDATALDPAAITYGGATEVHVDRGSGEPRRHVEDVNGDGLDDVVIHVRVSDIDHDCAEGAPTFGGIDVGRDFTLSQDWSRDEALSFMFHGTGSGERIGVTLKDNAAPDPGPTGWELAWSDEFDGAAGTGPNDANWTHEIGDVTPDGKNGWGNSELQYYTDSTDNAAHDGAGNLVITLRENEDEALQCYYGTCEYTSARLLSWHKSEFAYGRVESRLRLPVPEGGYEAADLRGLWPAFWSLGTDIDRTPWPAAGEIDIMEWVGRIPDEVFGTIHGPGYSGGQSFGGTRTFLNETSDDYHEFAIEWEPEEIRWYLDGELYHTATPDDVSGEWVFDKPFFLLLNFAVGGNFGGEVGGDVAFPQEYAVDYVRIYEAPDTAERFESSFTDDVAGWRQVTIPFTDFARSEEQPADAPDDGLTLDEVNGYGFSLLDGGTPDGALRIDQVRRVAAPAPTEFEVTSLQDGTKGSLRDAVDYVADGGTITIDPALAGETVLLESGPIVVDSKSVTLIADDLTIDGGGSDRVVIVESGSVLDATGVTLTNGWAWQLGGCVLNNGSLSLSASTVTGCTMATDAGDFWQGGGGIYTGEWGTLTLVDSVVSGNTSGWSGGGVYSFFNTVTTVERSSITGNVASDVGGGFRLLGDATIQDSTISGNQSLGWHGGALFLTDGVLDVSRTEILDNVAANPTEPVAAIFVGTFGPGSATMNISDSVVTGNESFGCFLAPWGAGAVAINSLGGNTFQDGSCNPIASDTVLP